jgi:hypothetical protein
LGRGAPDGRLTWPMKSSCSGNGLRAQHAEKEK